MLTRLGRWALGATSHVTPWTNVYGLARSLLALGTLLTLAFNDARTLFPALAGAEAPPFCAGMRGAGAFCAAPLSLDAVRWLACAALLVIASGWRPRWTALPHWWLAWSLQANAVTIEGGDQITAILTLLLLPVALTDTRRWHWSAAAPLDPEGVTGPRPFAGLAALSALLAIRIQVAAIYFDSVVGKLAVPEWQNGTALYYWLTHPTFGAPHWLRELLMPLLVHPGVAVLTWLVLLVEIALFMGLTVERRYRQPLLLAGLALHAGIMLAHGLVSFGLAMFGALLLFLRPVDRPFEWLQRRRNAPARARAPGAAAPLQALASPARS